MALVIIYNGEEGNLHLCRPTDEVMATHGIEWIKAKDTPEGSIIVDDETLPQADYDFFDSWELVDGKVIVNFGKAVEHTKERLRFQRTKLLAEQDILFQRALESGADTTAIVAEKKRLRDLTNLADEATTLDELRNLQP
jgi:hypothetical protein